MSGIERQPIGFGSVLSIIHSEKVLNEIIRNIKDSSPEHRLKATDYSITVEKLG